MSVCVQVSLYHVMDVDQFVIVPWDSLIKSQKIQCQNIA